MSKKAYENYGNNGVSSTKLISMKMATVALNEASLHANQRS